MKTTMTMKMIVLFGGALLLTAGVASAEPADEVVANVPFDFVVGTTPMPAGKYVVKTPMDDPAVVLIESASGRLAAFALTIPGDDHPSDQSQLVFVKHDNRYYLSRVMENDGESREIAPIHGRDLTAVTVAPANP